MRGSVIKKGDRWYVKIELDVDPATGRRRQKWHSGYNTKREAERARIDLLSKFDRGEYVEPTHQTVAAFMADWLRAIEPTIRPSTFESYERNVRNHVIAHIGSNRLTKVDAGVLNGLYALLLSSGRRPSSRSGTGYEPEVVDRALALRADGLNYIHTIVHRAFKDAVRWGRLARNPADSSDPPHGGQKSDGIHAWDAATLRSFLDDSRARGDRLHGLWVLLATTGMRRGEALGLRWRDVDLDASRVRIVQTLTQTRGVASISEPKTARGRRPISLDKATVAVLREHRKQMLKERLLVGPDFNDAGFVFHQPDGSRPKPDAVSATFLRRVESSGAERITLHGLRHTWATLALEKGIHPRVVQERLGHSTIAITLGIYSHVSPTLHDEAAELIGQLIMTP
jgi:integrase